MDNNSARPNRVSRGVPAGGQFASQQHSEAGGVTLTAEASPLDEAAIRAAGDLCRNAMNMEIGTWQRRVDRHYDARPEMPETLADAERRAETFESLDRDGQTRLMRALKLDGATHLLEPGQQLGNDRITIAEGLEPTPESIGMGLMAQKQVMDADLPGDITLTKLGDHEAEFRIEDGGVTHRLDVNRGYFSFAAEAPDEDYDAADWADRAYYTQFGPKVTDVGAGQSMKANYARHHEYTVMMSVAAESSFKEHHESFGEFNREERTVDLVANGASYTLDLSSDKPALQMGDARLHPSMSNGFLAHMAGQTGHEDAESFSKDLRAVFRETDRRLIR